MEHLVEDGRDGELGIEALRPVVARFAAPKTLRTVYGFGYALTPDDSAKPSSSAASAKEFVHLVVGRERIPIAEGETVLGRAHDAGIVLEDASVSRHHSRLVRRGRTVTIEDLGSKNGTFVEGTAVLGPTAVSSGDVIVFGTMTTTLRARTTTHSTRSAERR